MKEYICKQCSCKFNSKKESKGRIPQFCSRKCFWLSIKMHIKCQKCGNQIINKHSNGISKKMYCSNKCRTDARKGTTLSEDWKKALSDGRKKSEKCKGENLYNWKGGLINTRLLTKERYYRTKHNIIGIFPREKLLKILELQNNKCFYCECDLSNYKAIEHLTPVTKGGDNSFYNLVYSCRSCNSNKRQQTLEEYAIKNKRADWLQKWENILIELL